MENTAFKMLLITAFCKVVFGKNIFVPDSKDWYEAQTYCKVQHIDLSIIKKQKDEHKFQKTIAGMKDGFAWIGLHREGSNSTGWKWPGGGSANFYNWCQTHPGSLQNGSCVAHNGKCWNVMDCSNNQSFVCSQKASLVKQKMTWEQALVFCRDNNTDLVSLLSWSQLNQAVTDSLVPNSGPVWMGLRWLANSWLWVTGDSLDYEAWSQGHRPQCPAWNLQCGALEPSTKLWKSYDCEERLNFFCA